MEMKTVLLPGKKSQKSRNNVEGELNKLLKKIASKQKLKSNNGEILMLSGVESIVYGALESKNPKLLRQAWTIASTALASW